MVDKVVTKFAVAKKRGKTGAVYRSPRIYLPTKLTDDSTFPFKGEEDVLVRINGKKLVIQKFSERRKLSSKEGEAS